MEKRPRMFLFPGENEDWRIFRQRLLDGISTDIIVMDRAKFEKLVPNHSKLHSSVEDFAIIKMTKILSVLKEILQDNPELEREICEQTMVRNIDDIPLHLIPEIIKQVKRQNISTK